MGSSKVSWHPKEAMVMEKTTRGVWPLGGYCTSRGFGAGETYVTTQRQPSGFTAYDLGGKSVRGGRVRVRFFGTAVKKRRPECISVGRFVGGFLRRANTEVLGRKEVNPKEPPDREKQLTSDLPRRLHRPYHGLGPGRENILHQAHGASNY